MSMTMSTLPPDSAPAGSLPTSTIDSFKPSSSAMAAATSTSMPMILSPSLLMPAKGDFSVSTPTRSVPLCPIAGDVTVGLFPSGS